uniref:Uncharacterized protein n=1 Tax=Arundo donax TaxID=35708 RepID=A0A0A8XT36_ARUDO
MPLTVHYNKTQVTQLTAHRLIYGSDGMHQKKFKNRLELATRLFHGSSHCMNCTTVSIPWVRPGHCWDDMKCPIALY